MSLQDLNIEQFYFRLEDIWGMNFLFGEEAHDDPEEGFRVKVDDRAPEQFSIDFDREGDNRHIMIEQQGDGIMIYLYPNQEEVEKRILLLEDRVVTGPVSTRKHSIDAAK